MDEAWLIEWDFGKGWMIFDAVKSYENASQYLRWKEVESPSYKFRARRFVAADSESKGMTLKEVKRKYFPNGEVDECANCGHLRLEHHALVCQHDSCRCYGGFKEPDEKDS